MYAGRYLWWNMIAAMTWLFFSIYFYYVTWLAIRLSGCAKVAGSCGDLDTKLNAVIRPWGLLTAGVLVLSLGVMRIRYLRMSPLWGLALFIWFGASADFFFNFGNLWFAKTDMGTILSGLPVEALFLGALIAFMCFPVELYKKSPEGALRVIYYVAGFTASYSFSLSIANSEQAANFVRMLSPSDAYVVAFEAFQAKMRLILMLGHDSMLPIIVVFSIFISALSYLIVMRKSPGNPATAAA
jgi:hypothetical protein